MKNIKFIKKTIFKITMDNEVINETNSNEIEKIVPDTSVIIEGLLSDKISKNEIKAKEIIIHEAVLAELEHQANMGKSIGFVGLEEIKRIGDIAAKDEIELALLTNNIIKFF